MLAACAVTNGPRELPSITPAHQLPLDPLGPLSGLWQGRSTSYGNEIRNITLRITQSGKKVEGDYSCLPKNAVCRNLDDTGTLTGKVTNNKLAIVIVLLPDNSHCYFTGKVVESLIVGEYECLDRARIVEIGMWRVRRLV